MPESNPPPAGAWSWRPMANVPAGSCQSRQGLQSQRHPTSKQLAPVSAATGFLGWGVASSEPAPWQSNGMVGMVGMISTATHERFFLLYTGL